MTKFNKRVLAVAIAGAIMLPGAASAATMVFGSSQQITFAKDLIVNNGTTIYTPNDLEVRAETIDAINIATVDGDNAAMNSVRVKVTLTNGAKFDTTADAETLVEGFFAGTELNGAPTQLNALVIVGTPYYSTSGQELNFEFEIPAGATGADLVSPAFALEMNSFQITNLKDASDAGQSIDAEVTMQNEAGQQILAARETIADFEWGITSSDLDSGYDDYRIDVAECAGGNRTRFSTDGSVGACDATVFNAGGLELDITMNAETGGGLSYINNFSAVSANPQYNVVNTATWTFTVTGSDLAAFTGGDLFLSNDINCAGGMGDEVSFGTIATGAASASVDVGAGEDVVYELSDATPGPENIYVCFRGDDTGQMVPQELNLAWEIDYDLPTQRVNPPGDDHDLLPLLLNGTTITFQNVNPGSNPNAQSFLRVTNHNSFECPIVIDAKDDAGEYTADPANGGNTVQYTLGAQGSKQFNIDDLEAGTVSDATGMLGDGTGKWYVRVTAECANVVGSAWVRNAADNGVGNMTDERNDDTNLFGTW
ncbi:MAG TPA: hypothetical protein VFY12_11225 [Arenimonas sp.]|nr:hypothetical protein [Arenimonas sp.]